jgi:hypothetical protein
MTDTKTYLTRMVLFLVVVGAGSAFIASTLVGIFLVNPLLNGAIFAVILIGIALNFRQVVLLGPEARWIESFRNNDEAADATLRAQASDARLRLLSPMARMLQEKRGRGRITLSAQVMRTLLDGIAARLEESRDLSRYFTGLCIFLGLLGTFWGLLGTVTSVGDVVRNLSAGGDDVAAMFQKMKAGLVAPLSSMGTAFSSSLFGLAGSLALGFLDLQAGQAQNAFFNELEEWLSGLTRLSSGLGPGESEQGVSAYTEALLEQTAESLQELQTIMARTEQSRGTANQQMAELNDKLSILADQMRAEQQILLRMAEGQRDIAPLIRSLGDLATSFSAPGAAIDDATRGHIRNIDAAMGRLTTAITSGRDETVREIRNEIKLLAKTVASVAARDTTSGGD